MKKRIGKLVMMKLTSLDCTLLFMFHFDNMQTGIIVLYNGIYCDSKIHYYIFWYTQNGFIVQNMYSL